MDESNPAHVESLGCGKPHLDFFCKSGQRFDAKFLLLLAGMLDTMGVWSCIVIKPLGQIWWNEGILLVEVHKSLDQPSIRPQV